MSKIYYHPRAVKFLSKIPRKTSQTVYFKINQLRDSGFWKNLDIKKLVNTQASYRLRVANIRVIFELNNKNIYIHEIDFRGNIY